MATSKEHNIYEKYGRTTLGLLDEDEQHGRGKAQKGLPFTTIHVEVLHIEEMRMIWKNWGGKRKKKYKISFVEENHIHMNSEWKSHSLGS